MLLLQLKIDRKDARPKEVIDEVFDLFVALGATDEQLDFPILYASGRDGWAVKELNQPKENFKSGFLGNYFAKSMLPKEKLNKMKTFKDKNPIGSKLDKSTIDNFILQQEQILNLLEKAREVDLNKTKTAISISKWIKLKMGDTFRVVIYHNERHLVQANKI